MFKQFIEWEASAFKRSRPAGGRHLIGWLCEVSSSLPRDTSCSATDFVRALAFASPAAYIACLPRQHRTKQPSAIP